MTGVSHVIGAGVSGLSVATTLADKQNKVIVYETSRQAGGRCRSFFEQNMGCRIDNGNHLLLSGNTEVRTYLDRVGGSKFLTGPEAAVYPFVNLENTFIGRGQKYSRIFECQNFIKIHIQKY